LTAESAKARTKRQRPTFDDGSITRVFKFPSKPYPRSSYYVTSTEIVIRIKKARRKWKLIVPKKRVVSYRTNRWFAKPRWVEIELTYTQASKLGLVEPRTPDRPPVPTGPCLLPLAGIRVWIVDDNDTNRRILRRRAESWGMVVRDTALPSEALGWAIIGDACALAILDFDMPGMDGAELLTQDPRYDPPPSWCPLRQADRLVTLRLP